MVEILKYNDDDLKDNEIDQVVTRVRAFIMSSKNNFLIAKSDIDGYQLLGDYVDENEDLANALAKAICKETGIVLDSSDKIEPFFEIRHYNRDYKGSGVNRMSDLIYFFIRSDKLPNYKKLKLTEEEIIKKTPIECIPKYAFVKTLKDYIAQEKDTIKQIKAKEILIAYDKLKEIYSL